MTASDVRVVGVLGPVEVAFPDASADLPAGLADLIGREVDVVHGADPDPDNREGTAAFRGTLLEVHHRGLTLSGNDRREYPDVEGAPLPAQYLTFIPWSGFWRVEAVDRTDLERSDDSV